MLWAPRSHLQPKVCYRSYRWSARSWCLAHCHTADQSQGFWSLLLGSCYRRAGESGWNLAWRICKINKDTAIKHYYYRRTPDPFCFYPRAWMKYARWAEIWGGGVTNKTWEFHKSCHEQLGDGCNCRQWVWLKTQGRQIQNVNQNHDQEQAEVRWCANTNNRAKMQEPDNLTWSYQNTNTRIKGLVKSGSTHWESV